MTIHRTKKVSYNGITIDEYYSALAVLSNRMFRLFDSTGNIYNGNRGGSLMWQLSFTAKVISSDVCQKHIHGQPLEDTILSVLVENATGWTKKDLLLLK